MPNPDSVLATPGTKTSREHHPASELEELAIRVLTKLSDLLDKAEAAAATLRIGDRTRDATTELAGPKLSQAYDAWIWRANIKGLKQHSDRDAAQNQHTVRRFIELFGDLPIPSITKEMARQYRDRLIQLPTHLPRSINREHIDDILRRPDLSNFAPRYAGTVNKSITTLATILNHAESTGAFDAKPGWVNPFSGRLKLRLDRRLVRRDAFDAAELSVMFHSEVFSRMALPAYVGPAAFWYPLLGLFTGMRLGEIANLRVSDILLHEETRRWFIQVQSRPGYELKTNGSNRLVPIHRDLERIGFIDFHRSVLAAGAKPADDLWPAIGGAPAGHARTMKYSAWFRKWRRGLGINDRTKVFHSFRHNFKRSARDAGLSEEMNDWICGHSHSKWVGRGYGRGFSPGVLAESMDTIQPQVELGHLTWKPVSSQELLRPARPRPKGLKTLREESEEGRKTSVKHSL